MSNNDLTRAIEGSLLGTAVGDALGLPYENVSPRRIKRLCGRPTHYRFFFGRGMVSDDTEHSCLVAQALLTSRAVPSVFEQDLASRLRWWFALLPAGTGRATAQSILKLWLGYSTQHSGVFSAGNGPAMRAPLIGAFSSDLRQLVDLATRSARITHSDPKATYGAITVALAAHISARKEPVSGATFLSHLEQLLPDDEAAGELQTLLVEVVRSTEAKESTRDYAIRLCGKKGVTGYIYHTVPAAIHCWLSCPDDFQEAVTTIVACGGDADSTAAIVGGIVGAGVGRDGIPSHLLCNLCEWPCSVDWMTRLANGLAHGEAVSAMPRIPRLAQLLRNLGFLFIVLLHALRRLAPPY